MIDFKEDEMKITGHIGLGAVPTLANGTWNGRSLDEMTKGQLNGIIERITILAAQKFPKDQTRWP